MNKKTKIGLAIIATVILFAYIVPAILSNPYWLWGLRIREEGAASESLTCYQLSFVKGGSRINGPNVCGTDLSVGFRGAFGEKAIIFYNEKRARRAVISFDPSASGEDIFKIVENQGVDTGP